MLAEGSTSTSAGVWLSRTGSSCDPWGGVGTTLLVGTHPGHLSWHLCHSCDVPAIDLADDTYLACDPDLVAARVHEPDRWAPWWPGLRLTVTRDRGRKGLQWVARSSVPGPYPAALAPGAAVRCGGWARSRSGSSPGARAPWCTTTSGSTRRPGGSAARTADRLRAARARAWKRSVHALKDELEAVGVKPGRRDADNQGR